MRCGPSLERPEIRGRSFRCGNRLAYGLVSPCTAKYRFRSLRHTHERRPHKSIELHSRILMAQAQFSHDIHAMTRRNTQLPHVWLIKSSETNLAVFKPGPCVCPKPAPEEAALRQPFRAESPSLRVSNRSGAFGLLSACIAYRITD